MDKRGRYGRAVAKVLDGDRDVNLALVADGMWYRKYADEQSPVDQGLYQGRKPRRKRRSGGLWSDAAPVPPWEWRK